MNVRTIYPPNSLFEKISPFPPTYSHRFSADGLNRDYPLTLYDRGEDRRIRWLGFIYAFFYWNKLGEKVLRLERPSSFTRNERPEVYENLIANCDELARELDINLVEAELYREIGGDICFPSTLSFVDSYNEPEAVKFFTEAGFKKKMREFTFALNLSEEQKTVKEENCDFTIKRYKHSSVERAYYWYLWSENAYSMEDYPSPTDPSYPSQPDWELDFGISAANNPRFILFAWKGDEVAGYIHWLPNLYRIDQRKWKAKTGDWTIRQSRITLSGKIFKMVLDPASDSKDARLALCLKAMNTMRRCGLTQAQIGNVHADDNIMLNVVEALGGRRLHTIDLLEKKL